MKNNIKTKSVLPIIVKNDTIKIFLMGDTVRSGGTIRNIENFIGTFKAIKRKTKTETKNVWFTQVEWEICDANICHYWNREKQLCRDANCTESEFAYEKHHCAETHSFGFDGTDSHQLEQ
tara:strand:- start:373 stop:732 length:360 start_codon:yes stop_codon:yes gene_type:complete